VVVREVEDAMRKGAHSRAGQGRAGRQVRRAWRGIVERDSGAGCGGWQSNAEIVAGAEEQRGRRAGSKGLKE